MRIKKLSSLIGLSAALLLGSLTAAQAQGPGIYFGASWGAYSIKESTLNDNGRVLKGVVGAQFNNWFGVEGSWTDFNRADNGTDRFKADGKGLAAVGAIGEQVVGVHKGRAVLVECRFGPGRVGRSRYE